MAAHTTQPDSILPMSVQQAAASRQLGAFIKRYPGALVKPILGVLGILVLFLLPTIPLPAPGQGSGLILFILFEVIVSIQSAIAALLWSAGALSVVFMLILFIAIVWLSREIIRAVRQKVYLFEQGIVIENESIIQVFPWNQTTEVFQSITHHKPATSYGSYGIFSWVIALYRGTTYKYTLCRSDGYRIKLDNKTRDIAKLGQAIVQGVTQDMLPRVRHSILAGQTVTFGPFSINVQGIDSERNFISWQEVETVKIDNDRVSIKQAGKKFSNWLSTPVAEIPNCIVFVTLSQEMIQHEQFITRGYDQNK